MSGVARAGRVLFWIYLVLLFIVTMSEGSFLRGNIIYPVGFHRWMTALYVLVCAAWFEGALRYYFSGRAELEVNRREAQIPLAACIITFGYWMFVLVNYNLVEMADDWLGRAGGAYAGVLVDRGEAGGLLDLGTCPSVIVRIERGARNERHQICSNRIGLSPGLGAGQPVLVSGRHGIFGFAVDQIAAAPPGGPGAPR